MASTPPPALLGAVPPPSLHSALLPLLLRRLNHPATSRSDLLDTLGKTARMLAVDALRDGHLSKGTTLPLELALEIQATPAPAQALPLPILLDLTAAYPSHRNAVSTLWSVAFSASAAAADSDSDSATTDPGEVIQTQLIPSLVSKLQLSPSPSDVGTVARLLLALGRAHEELLAAFLSEADYILPALRSAYTALNLDPGRNGGERLDRPSVRIKEAVLLFCAELMGAVQGDSVREGLRRLVAGPPSAQGRVDMHASANGGRGRGFLRGNTLGEDLDYWLDPKIQKRGGVDAEVRMILEELRDDEARGDPRVLAILTLFPALPPHQLLLALNHPTYASSSSSNAEEQASPLLDVILSGGSGLPSELGALRRAIEAMSEQQSALSVSATTHTTHPAQPSAPPLSAPAPSAHGHVSGTGTGPGSYVRSNIFDSTSLDISRLRLKEDTDEPQPLALAPGIGKEVSDEMRARIMRLVERQRVEAEEQARAVAEARGEVYRPERDGWEYGEDEEDIGTDGEVGRKAAGRARGREGDESGEEEEVGENVVESRKAAGKKPAGPVQAHSYDVNIQSKLELAYLADAKVYDRDGATRRSAARAKLKVATGMDDSQLEGWRIMLDRNPHKEAILARHTIVPGNNVDYVVDASSDGRSTGQGSRGRGGGSSRGGGGGGGDRGGGGGGGRGRGGNKGSRGHSNAARTRGHDKKMTRMGQGA